MSIASDFDTILANRRRWEKNLGAPTAAQWADWVMSIMVSHDLRELALRTGAAALLTYSWEQLREQLTRDMERAEAPWSKAAFAMIGPIDVLLDPTRPAATEDAVVARFEAYVTSANEALTAEQATSPDETRRAGLVASVGVPAYADPAWADISLLWSQVQAQSPLIEAMGRQTGSASWSEWFQAKFDTVKGAIPALAEMGAWAGLAKIINALLGVGLVPVLGTNLITFGSNLLTPLKALIHFPKFMETQAQLYRLHEYGEKKLRLPHDNKVMKAIASAISSVDWAAVGMAFKATPFALLIVVYSGAKFLVVKAKPSAGAYHADAAALIDAADQIHDGETNETRLALMTIMHLSGGYEAYIKLMTERRDDAVAELASKMDF